MSQKDLQFIERALAHPWMFWVYFWKWPRIVRQACAEYDLLAKERDAAKAAHERSERANKIVRDWIHVTHRLSTTPEAIRAIFAAGKRLSILLVFFVVTNTVFGQAPPYLRNQWTTNANPLALKVISTNGVHAATNVWELDFTNTATVTVSAVSNANKVMVSFTGSGGGDSLWTNVASGSAVLGDILTPIEQYGIFQMATNRLAFWGDYATALSIGYPPANLAYLGTNVPILILIGDYAGAGAVFTNDCFVFTGIGEQVFQNLIANNSSRVAAYGEVAMGAGSRLTGANRILAVGDHALYSIDINDCEYLVGIGHAVLEDSAITNCDYMQMEGISSGQLSSFHSCQKTFGLGLFAITSAVLTNCGQIMAIGTESALQNVRLTNCFDIVAMGFRAGTNLALTAKTNVFIFGNILSAIPDSREFWFGNTNNVYRMPGNIGTIRGVSGYSWPTAHAAGVWTNDGAGVTGWKPLSDFVSGSGGIASVFTNNVLAGGPGLTELGLTNSSTVKVAATTNAGRSTVSFDSRTNNSGVFVVQGTSDNGFYVAQGTDLTSGSIRLGLTSPKLGLERTGLGHFLYYSISTGDTWMDTVFGGAKLNLAIAGSSKWQVANAGHFVAATDNTFDFGASGATRPRNAFIANVVTSASFASAATNRIAITASGYTNTLTVGSIAVDVDVYFDAATAALQDSAGNVLHTFQAGTNITAHLKPNWRLVGTTMSGNAIAH